MALNPAQSFTVKDAFASSIFFRTMLIVGQSNTAAEGLYQDIELKSSKEIDTIFGADSHIAACIKDALTMFASSIVKPKIWVISYQDEVADTARVLTSTVTGTATESKTLKIKLNSLNPDRLSTQVASVLSLRNTRGASCGSFARNTIEFGSTVNLRRNFNPKLSNAKTNDVIVEVTVSNGDTENTIAAAIDAAINAKANAIYGSSVATNAVTLTANHKGLLSNEFSFEIIASSIPAGVSIGTVETTPGAGVVDASAILSISDDENTPLEELNFDYVSIPNSYSVSALVTDSFAKHENVLAYNNQCLEYKIIRGYALDLSNDTALDALAVSEPIVTNGITKIMLIAEKDGLAIKAVNAKTKRNKIENKQFTPIQRELDKTITVGNTYTLSDQDGFINIERVLASYAVREILVEIFIPTDFAEADFADGENTDETTYNRAEVIALFKNYRDILDGTNVSSELYGNLFATLVDSDAVIRSQFEELLDATVSFDAATKQLALQYISKLINPIKSVFTSASFK